MNHESGWKWTRERGWYDSGAPVESTGEVRRSESASSDAKLKETDNGAVRAERRIRLNRELIHACFNGGCPTREQAALMGLRHPLPAGWLQRLCGTLWPVEKYERLKAFRKPLVGEADELALEREWLV